MNYTAVSHCGTDHSTWLKNLEFYDGELDILEDRLLEIVKKNNGREAMEGVEHFQNQFIIQRNNLDELRHAINEHNATAAADAEAHAARIKTSLVTEHVELEDRYNRLDKLINELRLEFNRFVAKWL
jgi:hypothetical protein